MARVKRGTTVRQKHNKILARAKGFLGRHSTTLATITTTNFLKTLFISASDRFPLSHLGEYYCLRAFSTQA